MTRDRRPDPIREALQVRIELNARAAERSPLPEVPPKPEANHITEADLLRGYGLVRGDKP